MGRGGLSVGRSSVGPQPALCARQSAWGRGCFLSLWCYQHRMTSHFPCPLSPFAVAARMLWRYLRVARYFGIGIVAFVNTAKNRTAPSWKDPQSPETLRSSRNQVHIQQSTGVFKGGGMTPVDTCDRWSNRMPLCRGQAEWLWLFVYWQVAHAITLTGRPMTHGMRNRRPTPCLFHQEDVCLSPCCGPADLHYCTWDIVHPRCI